MPKNLRKLVFVIICGMFAVAAPLDQAAWAQSDASAANCNPITDPDTKLQAEICSAHAGCNLVLKLQRACTATKQFLTKLGDLFSSSGSSTLTSEEIFDANTPEMLPSADLKRNIDATRLAIQRTSSSGVTKELTNNGQRYFESYGQSGWGMSIDRNGNMERGQFRDGRLDGLGEYVSLDGSIMTGRWENGDLAHGASQVGTSDIRLVGTSEVHVGDFKGLSSVGMTTVMYADGTFQKKLFDENGALVAVGAKPALGAFAEAPPVPADVAARLAQAGYGSQTGAAAAAHSAFLEATLAQAGTGTPAAAPPAPAALVAANSPTKTQTPAPQPAVRPAAASKPTVVAVAPKPPASSSKSKLPVAFTKGCDRDAARADMLAIGASRGLDTGPEVQAHVDDQLDILDSVATGIVPDLLRNVIANSATDHASDVYARCLARNSLARLGQPVPPEPQTAPAKTAPQISRYDATGLPFAQCQSQENSSGMDSKLETIPHDDTVGLLRGSIAALDTLTLIYRQCLPDSRAQELIEQYRQTRASAVNTCQKIASNPGNCVVSPF